MQKYFFNQFNIYGVLNRKHVDATQWLWIHSVQNGLPYEHLLIIYMLLDVLC